jgi:hypothetical protein
MRRVVVVVALMVTVLAIAVGALAWRLGDGPAATPDPVGHEAGVPATRPAVVLLAVPFHRAPAGPALRDEFGENEELARVGQVVTVLEDRVVPGSGQWVRVFVEVDPSAWPGDFYAWLPVAANGRPVLDPQDVPGCPETLDLAGLAPLSPSDRLRCAGGDPITLHARVVFASGYAAYDVRPAFFGGREDRSAVVGLADPDRVFGMSADTSGPWLDAVVAPGVPFPPLDVDARITGRFDHPLAATCRRTYRAPAFDPPAPADAGPPPEAPADSIAWCRGRFVITSWVVTAGPERRPPVAGEVQLHRTSGGACGGVGMDGPLVFRIDLTQPDPVWIARPGDDVRIIPRFSNRFSFVRDPEPGISDGAGLVIRDGTAFDPNTGFAGHGICPGGATISFD